MGGAILLTLAVLGQAKAADPAIATWRTHTSTKGQYSVALPTKPTEKKRPLKLDSATADLTVVSVRRGTVVYSAASGDLSQVPADPEALLNQYRDDLVKREQGTLADEKKVELGGHPGREVKIAVPTSVVVGGAEERVRIYLVGKRLFELTSSQPTAAVKGAAPQVDAFFASFKLGYKPEPFKAAAPKEVAKAAASAPAAEVKWVRSSPPDGHFSILFPGRPADPENSRFGVGFAAGKEVQFRAGPQTLYQVEYRVSSEAGPMDALGPTGAFDMEQKSFDILFKGSTITKTTPLTLGNAAGREIRVAWTGPKGEAIQFRVRYFALGHQFYKVWLMAPRGELDTPDANKFFDSFAIEDTGPTKPSNAEAMVRGDQVKPGVWVYSSPKFGFQIDLPSEPREQVDNAPGRGIKQRVTYIAFGEKISYVITCLDLAGQVDDSRKMAQQLARASVRKDGSKITSEGFRRARGLNVYEVSIQPPPRVEGVGIFAKNRAIVTKDRAYILEYRIREAGTPQSEGDEILDSFEIK